MIGEESFPSIIQRCQADPVWFFDDILQSTAWSTQKEIALSVRDNPDTSVKGCHSPGKSYISARIALWFLYSFPHSLVITTAPTDRQVRGILWKEISVAYKGAKFPLGGKLITRELKLDDDWFAIGFTAPDYDPNRFQGFHAPHVLVICDESSGISEDISEAIDGVLSGPHCRRLDIGNPTDPLSAFAKTFKNADVFKFTISAYDTPNFTDNGITETDIISGSWQDKLKALTNTNIVTPQWASKIYKKYGLDHPFYVSRVKAEFPKESKNTLIRLSWIEAAQNRDLQPGEPVEIGADIAGDGSNETVIGVRRGPVFRILESFVLNEADDGRMETARKIAQYIASEKASCAKVDGVGIGDGVVGRLKEDKHPVIAMMSGSSALNKGEDSTIKIQFGNIKAQWFWELRERFESGDIDIDPDDEDLAAQLAGIKYRIDGKDVLWIVSKKDDNTDSPDRADTLNFAFGVTEIPELDVVPMGMSGPSGFKGR